MPYESPKKVFYLRLSENKKKNKDGSANLEDYENQLASLRKKWGNCEVFAENISGGKTRRVLMKLLRTLPKGSTIYALHSDRLSRAGILDLLSIVQDAKRRDITLETYHEGKINEEKHIFIALRAYAAEEERLATKRRIQTIIADRAADGLLWGGAIRKARGEPVPYGTKPVNPLWARALPRLIELQKEGLSIRQIAIKAGDEFGERFSHATVHRLLGKVLYERVIPRLLELDALGLSPREIGGAVMDEFPELTLYQIASFIRKAKAA